MISDHKPDTATNPH